MAVQCWPDGYATRNGCDNEIPDTESETMSRFGWGFCFAPDPGSISGTGAFYACPEHREDLDDEEQREVARKRYAAAKGVGEAA